MLINLTVVSTVTQANTAFAVWNIPRAYSKNLSYYVVSGAQRFIPIRAAFSQNLHGIIVANIVPGTNNISVLVTTKSRTCVPVDMQLGTNLRAKVLTRDGISTAYLYTIGATGSCPRSTCRLG